MLILFYFFKIVIYLFIYLFIDLILKLLFYLLIFFFFEKNSFKLQFKFIFLKNVCMKHFV
jgi:hypothetical protein